MIVSSPGANIGAGLPQVSFIDGAREGLLDETVRSIRVPSERPRIATKREFLARIQAIGALCRRRVARSRRPGCAARWTYRPDLWRSAGERHSSGSASPFRPHGARLDGSAADRRDSSLRNKPARSRNMRGIELPCRGSTKGMTWLNGPPSPRGSCRIFQPGACGVVIRIGNLVVDLRARTVDADSHAVYTYPTGIFWHLARRLFSKCWTGIAASVLKSMILLSICVRGGRCYRFKEPESQIESPF
jgi:hypothetical protein